MSFRRELLIAVSIVAVGWVMLMVGLAKWQHGNASRRVAVEPEFAHYPGTEDVQEQTSPSLGLRKYWFMLHEDFPSQSVFYFYEKELGAQGWRLVGKASPQWRRQTSRERTADVFRATWLDPKGLFQLDLEMVSPITAVKHELSIVTEEREPGMRVYVTMRRALAPGLVMPPQGGPPRSQVGDN